MGQGEHRPRREHYAAMTRAAVIAAARDLYRDKGYAGTRVEDIAAHAGVAPATVYTSVGSKAAILAELIAAFFSWRPRDDNFQQMTTATTSSDILAAAAHGTRQTHEHWWDVLRLIDERAPHDPIAKDAWERHLTGMRGALDFVVDQMARVEGPGFDSTRARTALWFYFNPGAYQCLHDDLTMSYDDAQQWLLDRCCRELDIS